MHTPTTQTWRCVVMCLATSLFGQVYQPTWESLGNYDAHRELKWRETAQGMEIALPQKPDYGMAYPVRIQFNRQIDKPAMK